MQGGVNHKGHHGTSREMTWTNVDHAQTAGQLIITWWIAQHTNGMKSLGYAPDEEDMSPMEKHEYCSGLIIKIGARCFFCNQEGHLRMNSPLFWEAVKNQSHPRHKLAIAVVQNQKNRHTEYEPKHSEVSSAELPTKTVKAVTQLNSAIEATARNALEINYEKAAAEAINKVKQDLAKKEIEQRLKQEIEKQKLSETLGWSVPVPEAVAGSKIGQRLEIATL